MNRIFQQIYDGPYLKSPILLSHNGTKNPNPIQSSSNNLYVEFPLAHPINFDVLLVYTNVSAGLLNLNGIKNE